MFLVLKNGEQRRLLNLAISKAGSIRKLATFLKIPHQSIEGYLKEKLMPENRFVTLMAFLEIEGTDKFIEELLPDNWRQIKGGKNCVIAKKKKGTFSRDMQIMQRTQAVRLKNWHKIMKSENPEEYHTIQYGRFKKVADYKYLTLKGDNVRNVLEKDVANILFKNGVNYEYEPLVRVGNKFYFPDFLIGDRIIVECTMWRGLEKAYKLRDKLEILKRQYKTYVVIPKALYSYYKTLENSLVKGIDEFASLAQTFPKQIGKGSNR